MQYEFRAPTLEEAIKLATDQDRQKRQQKEICDRLQSQISELETKISDSQSRLDTLNLNITLAAGAAVTSGLIAARQALLLTTPAGRAVSLIKKVSRAIRNKRIGNVSAGQQIMADVLGELSTLTGALTALGGAFVTLRQYGREAESLRAKLSGLRDDMAVWERESRQAGCQE